MAIKSMPYHWTECDGCQRRLDDREFGSWESEEQALAVAEKAGWHIEDGQHLCYDCANGRAEA